MVLRGGKRIMKATYKTIPTWYKEGTFTKNIKAN